MSWAALYLQPLCIFSVGYIMAEGRMTCYLVTLAALMHALTTITAIGKRRTATLPAAAKSAAEGPIEASRRTETAAGKAAGADQQASTLRKRRTAPKSASAEEVADADGAETEERPADAGPGAGPAAAPVFTASTLHTILLCCGAVGSSLMLCRVGLIDRGGKDPHDKSTPELNIAGLSSDSLGDSAHLLLLKTPLIGVGLLAWFLVRWVRTNVIQLQPDGKPVKHTALKITFYVLLAQLLYVHNYWQLQRGHKGVVAQAINTVLEWLFETPFGEKPAVEKAIRWVYGAVNRPQVSLGQVAQAVYVWSFYGLQSHILATVGRAVKAMFKRSDAAPAEAHAPGVRMLSVMMLLVAPLIMVLGHNGPLLMFFSLVLLACVAGLHMQSTAAAFGAQAAAGGPGAIASGNVASARRQKPWGMLLWVNVALQLFFCTGHFCEFSGLQYAAPFIGFNTLIPGLSGGLLAFNTFGPFALAILVFCFSQWASGHLSGPAASDEPIGATRRMQMPVLLFCGCIVQRLACTLILAAYEYQHILVWAIFAPKIMFEVAFSAIAVVLCCAFA